LKARFKDSEFTSSIEENPSFSRARSILPAGNDSQFK
jgi:hypothetical protein